MTVAIRCRFLSTLLWGLSVPGYAVRVALSASGRRGLISGLGSIQGETGADIRSMYGNNVQAMVEASRSQKMMILYPRRWVVTVAIPTETVVAYCRRDMAPKTMFAGERPSRRSTDSKKPGSSSLFSRNMWRGGAESCGLSSICAYLAV